MTATDELLQNNEAYVASVDAVAAESFSDLDSDVRQSITRIKVSPFIPRTASVRGFVYELETGPLREVAWEPRAADHQTPSPSN